VRLNFVVDAQRREVLRSIEFWWWNGAEGASLWSETVSALHRLERVFGLHRDAVPNVLRAFADLEQQPDTHASTPIVTPPGGPGLHLDVGPAPGGYEVRITLRPRPAPVHGN